MEVLMDNDFTMEDLTNTLFVFDIELVKIEDKIYDRISLSLEAVSFISSSFASNTQPMNIYINPNYIGIKPIENILCLNSPTTMYKLLKLFVEMNNNHNCYPNFGNILSTFFSFLTVNKEIVGKAFDMLIKDDSIDITKSTDSLELLFDIFYYENMVTFVNQYDFNIEIVSMMDDVTINRLFLDEDVNPAKKGILFYALDAENSSGCAIFKHSLISMLLGKSVNCNPDNLEDIIYYLKQPYMEVSSSSIIRESFNYAVHYSQTNDDAKLDDEFLVELLNSDYKFLSCIAEEFLEIYDYSEYDKMFIDKMCYLISNRIVFRMDELLCKMEKNQCEYWFDDETNTHFNITHEAVDNYIYLINRYMMLCKTEDLVMREIPNYEDKYNIVLLKSTVDKNDCTKKHCFSRLVNL